MDEKQLEAQILGLATDLFASYTRSFRQHNCIIEYTYTTVQGRFRKKPVRQSGSGGGWSLGWVRAGMAVALTDSGLLVYNVAGISGNTFYGAVAALEYDQQDRLALLNELLYFMNAMSAEFAT